jgi:hypothetical protein
VHNTEADAMSNELRARHLKLKNDLGVDTSEYISNYENFKILKAQYQKRSPTNPRI